VSAEAPAPVALRDDAPPPAAVSVHRAPVKRLAFLDAVRGLAAFAVFVQHAGELISPPFQRWCHDWFDMGNFGVVAFFLVSGIIIPASLERYASLARFWRGRFWRLYPLYWANLGALLITGYLGWLALPPFFHTHPWVASLANVTMLQEFVGIPHANGAYWTLSVEMVFYVMCSLLFLRKWLSHSVAICVALALGLFALDVVADVGWHRSLPVGHAAMLVTAFFGTVIYRVRDGTVSWNKAVILLVLVAAVIAHGMWLRFGVHATPIQEKVGTLRAMLTSWGLAYAMFFGFYALRHRALPGPLLWLGKITYSLYLMHGLVIHLLPQFHPALAWGACAGVLSLGLASLTYIGIERPLMRRA
jgi:peptidoglycan/LPS O-acetylase OafA/YrhL